MDGKTKKIAFIVAIVVVLLFIFLRKKKEPVPVQTPEKVAIVAAPAPRVEPKRDGTMASIAAQAQVSREARKAVLRMTGAGFGAIGVNAKNPVLNYNALPYERKCRDGDLDVIKYDLEISGLKKNDLLFSLEPITDGKGAPRAQSQKVSFSDLLNKHKGSFSLPPMKDPVVLGLYLCSTKGSSNKEHPCGSISNPHSFLDLINMQTAIVSNPKHTELKAKYPKGPKIYFYQMLIAGPWGVYIYANKKTLPFDHDLMKKALNVEKYPYLERDMNHGISLMKSIVSMSPIISGNNITLVLPHRGDCPLMGQPMMQ